MKWKTTQRLRFWDHIHTNIWIKIQTFYTSMHLSAFIEYICLTWAPSLTITMAAWTHTNYQVYSLTWFHVIITSHESEDMQIHNIFLLFQNWFCLSFSLFIHLSLSLSLFDLLTWHFWLHLSFATRIDFTKHSITVTHTKSNVALSINRCITNE